MKYTFYDNRLKNDCFIYDREKGGGVNSSEVDYQNTVTLHRYLFSYDDGFTKNNPLLTKRSSPIQIWVFINHCECFFL